MTRGLLVVAWTLWAGCSLSLFGACSSLSVSSVLPGTAESGGGGRAIPTRCVVAAPFSVAPQVEAAGDDLSGLLGAYLVETLGQQGLRVIGAAELNTVVSEPPGADARAYAQRVAFVADREFGCDVVAIGRLDRFRDRSGEALGSAQPASVAFDLELYGAPGGQSLWRGRFDETQKALTENLWRASKYPGGGTRWLSANEFARFGLREVLDNAPLVTRGGP